MTQDNTPSLEELNETYEEFVSATNNSSGAPFSNSTNEIEEELDTFKTSQDSFAKGAKVVQQLVDGASSLGQQDVSVFVGKKKADPGMPYTFVFWDRLKPALIEHSIKMNDFLVLATCAQHLEYGNKLSVSQKDISEDLKISPPNISASVKKLVKAGILIKEGSKLMMNWHYIAKGNLNNFVKSDAKAQRFKHVSASGRTTTEIAVSESGVNVHIDQVHSEPSESIQQQETELPF